MSEEQQQSQAGDTGATPTRQPESYWRSRAEAAASIPHPMYASNAGATRMRQSLSYWRSLANAAAKMLNPVNASSSEQELKCCLSSGLGVPKIKCRKDRPVAPLPC
ncbi:hypothetical protein Bbelb_253010 [Branchiostoma belcheri]|nr:hypothetical protein Bbelb_253010 [Branchiostoma belcheri]